MRIVLLLAVAGMASGIAGAVFTGGETAADDPATRPTDPRPPVTEPTVATEAATADPPPAAVSTPTLAEPETAAPPPADAGPAPTPTAEPETTDPAPPPTPSDNPATTVAAATARPEAEPPAIEPAAEEAVAELIERLRPLVAAPDPNAPDYDRDHFAGWLDADGDCVNTRHEILQEEAAGFSMNAEGCAVASGEWFDPYTDRTYTNPRDLDVDHVVALADAWVSGAWRWADEVLDRFSNDLGNLNAIAAGENRSKSAKGPAQYSPSAPGARCDYLVQYATVKIRWELSITPQDFDVVSAGLRACNVGVAPDASPTVSASTSSAPPPSTTTTTAAAAASGCHPAYEPCLPNLPGDALNCGDLRSDQKPVTVLVPGDDPYRLDRDGDGRGCTS